VTADLLTSAHTPGICGAAADLPLNSCGDRGREGLVCREWTTGLGGGTEVRAGDLITIRRIVS
jgi:hypothetical protein